MVKVSYKYPTSKATFDRNASDADNGSPNNKFLQIILITIPSYNPFAKSGIEDKNRLRVNSTERGHGVKQLSN